MRVITSKNRTDNIKDCRDLEYDEIGIVIDEGRKCCLYKGCVVILPYNKEQLVCIGNIDNSSDHHTCKITWNPLPNFQVRVVKAHLVIEE
jgi:hypothetical protein